MKPDGTIATVAGPWDGKNVNGSPLDGSPAMATRSTRPERWRSNDGLFTFADDVRVRQIGHDGIVTTIAGTPRLLPSAPCYNRYCGDGVPATASNVGTPAGIGFAPDGSLLISAPTSNVDRILRVDNPLPRFTTGTFVIPSADAGALRLRLRRAGTSRRDALTGALKYVFGYDAPGGCRP